jgi:hypothetical protein
MGDGESGDEWVRLLVEVLESNMRVGTGGAPRGESAEAAPLAFKGVKREFCQFQRSISFLAEDWRDCRVGRSKTRFRGPACVFECV